MGLQDQESHTKKKWLKNDFAGPRGKWLKNDSNLDSSPEWSRVWSHFRVTSPGPEKSNIESPKVSFLDPGSVAQRRFSGQVRPRQGTEICNFGAPSPLEALHWIFCFFSGIYMQFSKTSPLNLEKAAKNPVEKIASNPVTSVAVMVFSALSFTNLRRGVNRPVFGMMSWGHCWTLLHVSGIWNRPLTLILLKSISLYNLPFLSRYFCNSVPCYQKIKVA